VSVISTAQLTPVQGTQKLIGTINSMPIPTGTKTSLNAPLKNAIPLLTDNNPNNDKAVCNTLGAFLNQVNAKERLFLTPQQAADLRQQATSIQDTLGCFSSPPIK
jgi:hypothetical protein